MHRKSTSRPRGPPKGVIFDLGDVLFTWSPRTSTKVPVTIMKSILSSEIWFNYECGLLERDVCFDQISQQFSVPATEVAEAFSQARESLQPNHAMVAFIHDLKQRSQGAIQIYAMSNISKEDYNFLSSRLIDWSIFDQVFTSGYTGIRKPDSEFYRYVLQRIELSPEETLFVDDRQENILVAKSLGINSIMFNDNTTVIHSLKTILYDPIGKAFQYLNRQAHFDSITDTGICVSDNFARLMILDTMRDQYVSGA